VVAGLGWVTIGLILLTVTIPWLTVADRGVDQAGPGRRLDRDAARFLTGIRTSLLVGGGLVLAVVSASPRSEPRPPLAMEQQR
jgi:hypothetical protein